MSDPNFIDPSTYFQASTQTVPNKERTANSHIKVIYDHDDLNSRRVVHLIRDYGIEPDIIHFRYSPLSRRELMGLFKAIPERDLEFFVKLKSHRYQNRPFTISHKTPDQTINHIFPHQHELLNTPIVYNALTNTCVVAVSPEKAIPIIQREVMGNNELWDGLGDLFEIPAHLNMTRSAENQFMDRFQKNQVEDAKKLKREQSHKELMKNDLVFRERVVSAQVEKQMQQFQQQYDGLHDQWRENEANESPGRDGNHIRTSSRYFGDDSQQRPTGDVIDPRTGKPTLESLGLGKSSDSTTAMREKHGMKYPGEHPRIEHQAFRSRQQWRKHQEKTFGNLDETDFDRWKREKREKQQMGITQ